MTRAPCSKRVGVLALAALGLACSDEAPKQFVLLADGVALPAAARVELPAPEPLRTPAYHHQLCFLPVAPARLGEDPMGVVDGEGRPIVVRATASGPDGELELPLSAYQGERICYGVSDAELERRFVGVHLWASATLRIEGVEWQSTDK